MNKLYHSNEDLKAFIKVNRNEVLRYLAYHGTMLDEEMDLLIDSCIDEVMAISQFRYVYGIFGKREYESFISLDESTIELSGTDIREHLKDSNQVIVMAATLGIEVEKRIKYYSKTDLTRGIILDSCAAQLVEELCDHIEEKIQHIAVDQGLEITSRFSPGYGDLPITIQDRIISSLNATRLIGLHVSDSSILLPRKSVTAFIGLTNEISNKKRTCSSCSLYGSCQFNKEGEDGCAG